MGRPTNLVTRFRVDRPRQFRLKEIDPAGTGEFKDEEHARSQLEQGVKTLCSLQEKLYAQAEWSLLLVFQAMDAAGKDAAIKHVLSGLNPQSCAVTSFKAPSAKELRQDFLWRAHFALPERGHIGVFNRSYYEEVLLVRVHPDYMGNQKIPPKLVTKKIWRERYESINDFEKHLARNGTVVLKFLLHLSRFEQKKRILERLDNNEKNWKFDKSDVEERQLWNRYMSAFETTVRATSTATAPWHVIPADHKWFTHLAVSAVIIDKLRSLDLRLPKLDAEKKKEMKAARAQLVRDR